MRARSARRLLCGLGVAERRGGTLRGDVELRPTMIPSTRVRGYARRGKYIRFILPALAVVLAVIVFPWVFTLWMSLNDWQIGQSQRFVGLQNFAGLARDERFLGSIGRTIYYTVLAVVVPVVLGCSRRSCFTSGSRCGGSSAASSSCR